MEWKDVTSYSRSDKDRKPTCFEIQAGLFRITLVWGHIYHPKVWVTSMSGVYERHDLKLTKYDDVEIAKNHALGVAQKVLSGALKIIEGGE